MKNEKTEMPVKQPYEAPELSSFGKLEDLTQGSNVANSDGGGGSTA